MRLHIENLQQQIEDLQKEITKSNESEQLTEKYKNQYEDLKDKFMDQKRQVEVLTSRVSDVEAAEELKRRL